MHITESSIEEAILVYLNYVVGAFAWKNPTAGYYDSKIGKFRKQKSKFAINGGSDILLSYKNVQAIEVKTPKEYAYLMKHYEELRNYIGPCKKKNHLRDQIFFIEQINKTGNVAFFADSVERVREKLKELS